MSESHKPSTIDAYLAAIRGVAKKSCQYERMSTKVYQLICFVERTSSNRNEREKKTFELKNLREILDAILVNENEPASVRDATLLALLFGCGLRRAEASNALVNDVDFKLGTLKVTGKGNKVREIPIPERALDLLNEWVDEKRGAEPGPSSNDTTKKEN